MPETTKCLVEKNEIILLPEGKRYSYEQGLSLLQILLQNEIFVNNPCGGKGLCGKCTVRVSGKNIPEISETERKLLKQRDLDHNIRLSCEVFPKGSLTVELIDKERKHQVLTSGYMPVFERRPDVEKVLIRISRPQLEEQTPFAEALRRELHEYGVKRINPKVYEKLNYFEGQMTAVLHDGELIGLEPGDTTDRLLGVAVDIGTTTVVCALIDLRSGEELGNASMINAQKHFGLDVLTRITYEIEHPEEGVWQLRDAIVGSINDMIEDVCRKTNTAVHDIYEISVGANCTMMHLLLGVSAVSIGKSPYAPMFTEAVDLPAAQIGLHGAFGARLYCLPSVSAYIGADIVAGARVCELGKEKENVLFIDIGTNGEIVLATGGKLLCCSCAAGPALEGMNISCGMRAAEGAIEDVKILPEGVVLKVIGSGEPDGICGSGILAVLKELLKCGLLKKTGVFVKPESLDEQDYRRSLLQLNGTKREFILKSGKKQLLITQSDIRQVQLAKGAILSGFLALLKEAGISMKELDKILIAGQFGAHLPAESLTGTGILPREVEDRIVYVGNTSKTGAYMALMSQDVKREIEELARHMDYLELGATEGYERLFSECLIFPEEK